MVKAHPLMLSIFYFCYDDVILITRYRHISNISDLIFIVVLFIYMFLLILDLPHNLNVKKKIQIKPNQRWEEKKVRLVQMLNDSH